MRLSLVIDSNPVPGVLKNPVGARRDRCGIRCAPLSILRSLNCNSVFSRWTRRHETWPGPRTARTGCFRTVFCCTSTLRPFCALPPFPPIALKSAALVWLHLWSSLFRSDPLREVRDLSSLLRRRRDRLGLALDFFHRPSYSSRRWLWA